MRIAIYLGHPAHFHLFRYPAEAWSRSHEVLVAYSSKDVLKDLVESWDVDAEMVDLRSDRRGVGPFSLAAHFARKELRLLDRLRRYRPDIILGTSIVVAHVGMCLGIPSVILNEDDFDVIAASARVGYPMATHIVAPHCCRTGRWSHKVVTYNGYHELAYLAPARFRPDASKLSCLGIGDDPFFVIRFASLTAHHDFGKRGISADLAHTLVDTLRSGGRVYITSERPLEAELEPFRLALDPSEIHHALALASLYVGDSQTMAAEAAVLGTPSVRFNDFVGRLSYLDELEHRYDLTVGIPTNEPARLVETVKEFAARPNAKNEWRIRRDRMLMDKIDLSEFLVWLIEGYPQSARRAQTDPASLDRFSFRHQAEHASA